MGRILGIPIGLDYSWFFIFGLVTWMLACSYFPGEFKGWPVPLYWLMGAATALLFFGSVLLHELGHSVVALRFKVPVTSITLFLFGGVAQLSGEPPSAIAEFLIAIAGPLVSVSLGVFFLILRFAMPGIEPVFALAKYLCYINFALAIFNMIPGYPMDGGRVLRAVVWASIGDMRRATIIAGNVGRFFGYAFIFVGVLNIFSGNVADGMWIAFIGWFLESAATAEVRAAEFRGLLSGYKVAQAMSEHCAYVPAEMTIQQLVDEHILVHGRRVLLVRHGNDNVGAITVQEIKTVPRAEWPAKTVGQAMQPIEKMKRINSDAGIWTALQCMKREGVNALLVTTAGHVAGLLTHEDVAKYLGTVQELA